MAVIGMAGLTTAMAVGGAVAQVGCLPPEEPYPYEPPRGDPELRAMIDEQYEAYVLGVEDYLNCLRSETDRASTEARTVIERWVAHFGDEAALHLRQGEGDRED